MGSIGSTLAMVLLVVLALLIVGSTSYEPPKPPVVPTTSSRRSVLQAAVAAGSAALLGSPAQSSAKATLQGYNPELAVTRPEAGQFYFPTLTPPFQNRATYRYELGRNAWALEQLLVFANVTATVRTVVVKMEDGGLWVNGPQWPTGEYCALLEELGPVKHVIVPCNAFEHKIPTSAFVKKYPKASVWVTPGQYGPYASCGLNLKSCKMGYRVDGVLPVGTPKAFDALPPWANEFDFRTLYVSLPENAGPVSEAAFLHRPSNTLITTDAVAYIPDEAPPIFGSYFDSDTIKDESFWPKSVLQAVFLPLRQGDGPSTDEQWPGYGAIRGRLVRAPILRAFSDARAPDAVREWVNSIPSMGKFDRILTAHFASPIGAETADLLQAFNFLDGPSNDPPISCGDWKTLDDLNAFIAENNLGAAVAKGFDYKNGCSP